MACGLNGCGVTLAIVILFQGRLHCDIQYLTGTDIDRMQRSNALLLKLKEKRCISQVAIDDVVAGSRNLISQTITHVQAGVKDKLAEAGIDPESIKGLNDVFESVDPFENLGTKLLPSREVLSRGTRACHYWLYMYIHR